MSERASESSDTATGGHGDAVDTLVITGTSTGVGKTVVTAALAGLAAAAGRRVAVLKPAQSGYTAEDPGDLAAVRRMLGDTAVTTRELARYPDPLSPDVAARRAGLPAVTAPQVAAAATTLAADHDLVLIEGCGGLLVRFDEGGSTLADMAWSLGAPALVVAAPALGTLNHTALTAAALEQRGVHCAGVVIGSWPDDPDLAERCNLADLPRAAGAPLLGALPAGLGARTGADFLAAARAGLSPWFDGTFDPDAFAAGVAATRDTRPR